MYSKSIDELTQFVSDYKQRFYVKDSHKVIEFQTSFSRLKTEFTRIKKEAGIRAVSEAPDFNIFYLMGMTRDEVRAQ